MVGSVADAEDIVQEALLRFHRAAREADIESPEAYLSAVTTRLAIDHLRSARVQREQYLGQWLPEPLLTDRSPDAADHADSLSLAFLVLLESLSPVARAVFLLGDVFGYGFAEVVGKSEDNCRQIAVRARRHVEERRPRFDARASRATSSRAGSSRLSRTATPRVSSDCSRRTSSSTATAAAAARRPRGRARSTAASASPSCSAGSARR
jgi:RNA polymerase sigma factor (sigma-70 family)